MSRFSLLAAAGPHVAVEIVPGQIGAILIDDRRDTPVVAAHAVESLPPGAVVAALNAPNVLDRPLVVETLRRAFARLGTRPRSVGVVIADSVAKVSLLRFDKVPQRSQDLDELVRYQMRKAAPFRIEDACVTYTPGASIEGGGREFVVALARRDIVQEYESVCATLGAQAGLVDLATFNVLNAVLAGPGVPSGDWLLVHLTSDYSTIAIMRERSLIFFRNRSAEGEGTLADLVHQTAMYYEDRLNGGGFERIILAGAAAVSSAHAEREVGAGGGQAPWWLGGAEQVRRSLEQRLGTRVESIDPGQAAPFIGRVPSPAALDVLAPVIGLVLRARAA